MTAVLLFLGTVWASDPFDRPKAPDPVKGECLRVIPINQHKPAPLELLNKSGIAECSAVAVPLSQFSDLLQTEEWGVAINAKHKIEISKLEMERDWYKTQLEDALKPGPWLEKPETQRWLGRIETIVIVGVVTAGLGTTYYYTSRAGK
jgi:hypothetical protein